MQAMNTFIKKKFDSNRKNQWPTATENFQVLGMKMS